MRMGRWDWLDRFFRPQRRKRKKGTGAKKRTFVFHVRGYRPFLAEAYTRSEARAEVKRALKLTRLAAHTPCRILVEAA